MNQISVYEICQTAQINRSTFYKYYGSQEELLQEIESDFFAQLNADMKDIIAKSPNALTLVLNHLYEQRKTFCILVNAIPIQDFTAQLFAIPSIGTIFQKMIDADSSSETKERYVRQFVFQGSFAVLCEWLNQEEPEPVSQIADVFEFLKSKI